MVTGSNSFCVAFYSKYRILGYDLYSTFPFHYSVNALYSTIRNLSYWQNLDTDGKTEILFPLNL